MSLVVASQLEPALNEEIARHPARPKVIAVPEDEPWRIAREADVLVVRPTPVWREARGGAQPAIWPGRLRWVCSASVGMDFYPRWLLDAPIVSCARGTASDEIADYVIAAVYRQTKDIAEAVVRSPEEWRYRPLGQVHGSTFGIVGFGAIGRAVARRATALGARVLAVRRSRESTVGIIGVEMRDSVAELVREADHIIIAVPATADTHHMFDRALLSRVKSGAHLINVARGSVVDQDALQAALDTDRLAFATLDVTDPEPLPAGHPLYTHPKVRLTPHISASYTLARSKLLTKILGDITLFAAGKHPTDVVLPERGY